MKPLEIKAEIIRIGSSYTDIANEAGSTVAEVSRCVKGEGLYLKIRKIIADKLNKKVDDVFADDHPEPQRKSAWCRTV